MEANEKPLSNEQHIDARDFRVKSVTLISTDGTSRNITALVPEIQVRQDIFLGFQSGEMVILDGIDLHTQAALSGGEYIFLHLEVPEQDISIKKAFRVYKVGSRTRQQSSQRYVLYFVSDELVQSNLIKISKAYTNTTISDIAYDIMVNILKIPAEKVFVEKTTTSVSVIIPNWRPTEALNWLASRAYSGDRSCFLFFENSAGYHFKSTQQIYKEGTIVKVPFYLENKTGQKNLDMDKFALDDYESKRDFDLLATLTGGGVAMELTTLDFISQSTELTTYRQDEVSTLHGNTMMNNVGGMFKKSKAQQRLYVPDFGAKNWVKRDMILTMLNNSAIEIVAPGNMGIQAGSLINLRIPYSVAPSDSDMWDKRKSGRWLIGAVNHKFDLITFKFTTLALLVRDSIPEALPAADSSLDKKAAKVSA